jgi:class 3 adenylate cyclase/predicted ATPase
VSALSCSSCGTQNRPGRRFCAQCGAPLELKCPSCGAPNEHDERFCGDCGAPLTSNGPAPAEATRAGVSERRLVSVLFADLVSFTTLSERRDPEDVRELLDRYFDRCKTLIKRYGGTVEKFIGDAVMAVWGTPVAREDDPERAVRAALDLTKAVTALGAEVGMPDLRVRAGVLTGEAAVRADTNSEGMVLGDTVNTASRLQSIAAPGTVLVDDVTRRVTEASIAYEDTGMHEVKGREEPVHAWTALRVVAAVGGARRSAGLEAPFVGRSKELAAITGASEESARERRAVRVLVVGGAGAGKSRLLWEYFKHQDGIRESRYWHQGRCLSYGDGVGYWALAEMIRGRAGILEEEEPDAARAKLRECVEKYVEDERERRLIEPRLAHLLGLEQRTATDLADLFSGWRLFFERLAGVNPVVMAFEDLQWADSGLLDFVDYLLEWSTDFPIFILALGRTELLDARPDWEPTVSIGSLPDEAMSRLLAGLVPGLPDELAAEIGARSEGVPLYAVETVRMLLDRGLVAQEGSRYIVTGDVSDLEVPESLHALVAARLDDLEPAERTLLQDASVIGNSFSPAQLAAVARHPEEEIRPLLDSLVSKQVLGFTDDPHSTTRGQYIFLQALLRTITQGTLSRRDRKARHLAIAQHIQAVSEDEAAELAEVLASHYVAAVDADPDAPDADELRALASQTLADAGRRALSLALGPEARRHFEHAAELAAEPGLQGRLVDEAATATRLTSEPADSLELSATAVELLRTAGLDREAAQAEGRAALTLQDLGRVDEAAERMARAYEVVDDGTDDEAMADLARGRASIEFARGNLEDALALTETALRIADGRRLGAILVSALITKGIALAELGRPNESTALLRHAAKLATDQGLTAEVGHAFFNLADTVMTEGRFAEAHHLLEESLELARTRGDRSAERTLLAQDQSALAALARWDDALREVAQLAEQGDDIWAAHATVTMPPVLAARGDVAGLEALMKQIGTHTGWRAFENMKAMARAAIQRVTAPGDSTALDAACEATLALVSLQTSEFPPLFAEVIDCAFAAGEPERVEPLLRAVDELEPGQRGPLLEAEAARGRARLATHNTDHESADAHYTRAIALFSELETPFYLARAQLEYAELLANAGGESAAAAELRRQAEAVFERLGARPWLERAQRLDREVPA